MLRHKCKKLSRWQLQCYMKHHLIPRHKIIHQNDIQETCGMFISHAYYKKTKLVKFCYPKLIIIFFDNCRTLKMVINLYFRILKYRRIYYYNVVLFSKFLTLTTNSVRYLNKLLTSHLLLPESETLIILSLYY